MNSKLIAILVGTGVVGIIALATACATCKTVQSGSLGVLKTMGKVETATLKPGMNFVMPYIQEVVPINTQMRAFPTEAHSASHDLQQVGCTVTLQHAINEGMVTEAFVAIGDLDTIDKVVISPAIQEVVKSVTSRYTAEELITKRETVKTQIKDELIKYIHDTLDAKSIKQALVIANVAITDFNFSQEFNQAIENKVKAEQLALQAENEKRQKVTQAEAQKSATQLAADADAYTTKVQADAAAYKRTVESKAEAAAIQRNASALKVNPLLVQYSAVQRWDGVMPATMVNGGGKGSMVPFINIPAAPARSASSESQAQPQEQTQESQQ